MPNQQLTREHYRATKHAEIARTWEQLPDKDREQYRAIAEEAWFVRER